MLHNGQQYWCNIRFVPYVSTYGSSLLFLVIAILFSGASSNPMPEPRDSAHNGPSTSNLYDKRRTFDVRMAAATCAAVSMAASFVAFYWFCRMEKRFRHRLIMLLIYGDLTRATWLFVFAVVSISRGTVFTNSSFCQASGFMLQYGTETSDYSVLAMAVHSAIQVFRPSSAMRSDGLYPYRVYVYTGAFLIPVLMACLAFINPNWGYMSQGAFCSLPLRPYWYRLALAWIPRYIIAIVILGLAVAIYTHVGFEFRAFSRVNSGGAKASTPITPVLSLRDAEEGTAIDDLDMPDPIVREGRRRPSSVNFDLAISSGVSVPFVMDGTPNALDHESTDLGGRSQSIPAGPRQESRPSSRYSDIHLSTLQTQSIHKPASHLDDLDLTTLSQTTIPPACNLPGPNPPCPSPTGECVTSPMQRHLIQQRARIHRQLRLMFIYPLVYILMWLVPFINHCMLYRDKWAAHPLYRLSLLSTICVTLMGAVDCLIFSLRERPWRHIAGTNGTFLGSFMCWRHNGACTKRRMTRPSDTMHRPFTKVAPEVADLRVRPESMFNGSLRNSVGTNRSIDQQRLDAGLARARLELEEGDRGAWRERGDNEEVERKEGEGSGEEGKELEG